VHGGLVQRGLSAAISTAVGSSVRAAADKRYSFGRTLGRAARSLVQELRETRNRWARQQACSGDDAYRALDSVHRSLLAVSAPQAETLDPM
jgi:hypothetical protein